MPQVQRTTKPTNEGCLINNNGKPLFIKQPNIMEVGGLYQAVMSNKKMVNDIFRSAEKLIN